VAGIDTEGRALSGAATRLVSRATMKLSVVILNWNAIEDTVSCLRAVRSWAWPDGVDRPAVWVVDNASRPPGIEPIRGPFPDTHIIESPINRGFGGGNNLGIEAALRRGAEAVLLLNNDASVETESVATMLTTLSLDPAIGTVGPTIWHRGECVAAGGRDIARYAVTHIRPRLPPASLVDVDYVPGTVALLRRQVFEMVGLFDEEYFFGGEMADLCYRARLHGFRSVIDPGGRARHDLDRSLDLRETLHVYYVVRNRFLYVRKHHARRAAWLYGRWILRGAAAALAALCRGNSPRARAISLGVLDGVHGRFGGRNERVLGSNANSVRPR
jgi:GT2 family glycosyltransferase